MTLTQTALLTKKLILAFIILIIVGISSKVAFDLWQRYQIESSPPVEEKAEEKFGPLPKIEFPSSVASSNFSYSIDTQTGGLPDFPKLINVYFITPGTISYLSPEKAIILAESFGIISRSQKITENIESFQNELGSLNINLLNGNFKLQKKLIPQSSEATFPSSEQLIQEFKNYLASKSLLLEGLASGRGTVVTEDLEAGANSFTSVSIWPEDINSLQLITLDPQKSTIVGYFYPHHQGEKFLKIDYTYFEVDQQTFSTYQVKSAQEALADLKSGGGFISLEPKSPQVSITSAYLAYLISEEYTPFLQPVIVFEGPNFIAVVPAIKNYSK